MKFPKIKKKIRNFLIDETGRISKQKIVNGFALISGVSSTSAWVTCSSEAGNSEMGFGACNTNIQNESSFYTDSPTLYPSTASTTHITNSNVSPIICQTVALCNHNIQGYIIKEGHHNVTFCDCDVYDCSCNGYCSCQRDDCTGYGTGSDYCTCDRVCTCNTEAGCAGNCLRDGPGCTCDAQCTCNSVSTRNVCTCQGHCVCNDTCSCDKVCDCVNVCACEAVCHCDNNCTCYEN